MNYYVPKYTIIIKLQYSVKCLIHCLRGAQNKIITVIGTTTDYIYKKTYILIGNIIGKKPDLFYKSLFKCFWIKDNPGNIVMVYIVSCRSEYRDNLILSSPVIRNKTFDGILKFYYYCKLGYIIIHFVKLVFYWILEWMSSHPQCLHRIASLPLDFGSSPLISSHGVKHTSLVENSHLLL